MYFGHVKRKKGDSLEKEIMQGTTPGSRSRGRPKTAWMSNITSWTGLSVEQLLRAVEDRYQWRLTAHDEANLRAHEDGWRQDKTRQDHWFYSVITSLGNYINVTASMACHHEMRQCWEFMNEDIYILKVLSHSNDHGRIFQRKAKNWLFSSVRWIMRSWRGWTYRGTHEKRLGNV